MGNPEKKVIEIKNSDDTGIKDKLSENTAPRLTDNTKQSHMDAFEKVLKPAWMDIFDNAKSELIRQWNTLIIAKKNADGALTPKLIIDGWSRERTYDLTIDFVKYLTNVPLRMIYQTTSVEIEKNQEITNLVTITDKEITDIYKEVSKERIKDLIWAVNTEHNETFSFINSLRKDALVGGFKLKMDEQQRTNVEILQKIAKWHEEDLYLINERFYRITGIDVINGKTNPDIKNDLRNPMYKETFIKYNADLLYLSKQFNLINDLALDPDFIRGKYKLSDTKLIDLWIWGRDRIESFGKLLLKNNAIDKERVEEMMKVAMVQLENEDYKALFDYLKGVSETTIDPTKEPFVAQNVEKVKELVKIYPFLKDYIKLNIEKRNKGESWEDAQKRLKKNTNLEIENTETENTGTTTWVWVDLTSNNTNVVTEGGTSTETAPNVKYENVGDAFSKGGIYGIIDHFTEGIQGKDPRTQQFYKSFGNAALTIWWAIIGWKVIRNAFRLVFGKKEDIKEHNSRARVLGWAGLMLATGGRPGELFRWGEITQNLAAMLGGIRAGGKNNKEKNPVTTVIANNASPETKEIYGISKTTALFEGMNFGQMAPFITQNSDKKMQLDTELLKNGLSENRLTVSDAEREKIDTKLTILKSLEDDKNNLINIGLNSLGLTFEQITSPANKDKSFNTFAGNALARMWAIGPYMQENKFVRVATEEPTKKAALESYIQTGYPTLEELKNGGIFITESGATSWANSVELWADYRLNQDTSKGKFAEQIATALPNLDQAKKNNIVKAGVLFYDYMPASNKQMKILNENGKTYFETYGFKTPVNFDNMFMDGLMSTKTAESGKAVAFVESLELLKAANLTNRIKSLCKNRKAKSFLPFTTWLVGRDIKFDDAEIFSTKFDTDIISAGYGWSLEEISPILEDHKKDYVTYLNKYVDCIRPVGGR